MIGFSSRAFLALLLSTSAAFAASPAHVPHDTAPMLNEDTGEPVAVTPDDVQNNDVNMTASPANAIHETSVNAPPIDGFGTLEQGRGGFPDDVWKNSTRDVTDALLSDLRTGVANETLQSLVTNLLMTQAAPPQGSAGKSWFAVRVNALIAIGQDEKAEQMIDSLPVSMVDASLLQIRAELRLARGEYDHLCQKVQPEVAPTDAEGEAFWRKVSILCKAHAGKQEEAMVGLDLMREEQHGDDPFFQGAIRRMGDKALPIKDSPKQWSVLNVSLLRLAGDNERIKDRMDAFPPISVKYLAQDSSLDIKLREKATARAQFLGIVPVNEGNKTPEQPFTRPLASDVTTLVTSLSAGRQVNDADNAVIARLALDDAGITDNRRAQRLLTLMEPFGYRVPPEVWQKLLIHRERYDGELPPASLVTRISDAAQNGRRGEVIVLAALIVGSSDLERISDLALLPVIKALILSGFDKEARTLAVAAVKSYSGR